MREDNMTAGAQATQPATPSSSENILRELFDHRDKLSGIRNQLYKIEERIFGTQPENIADEPAEKYGESFVERCREGNNEITRFENEINAIISHLNEF